MGQAYIPGLNFVATKTYLTSFITVSLFDMTKLSVAETEVVLDSYFPQVIRQLAPTRAKRLLKNALFSK